MAIAFVTGTTAAANGGTSGSINTTGATLLIAVEFWTNSASCFTSFSDSKTNVWVPWGATNATNTNGSSGLTLYYAVNPTVGSGHTFTLGTGAPGGCIAAFSGTNIQFPCGQLKINTAGSAHSLAPGSITPPLNNTLLIAAMGYRDTTTISIDGGFTISNQLAFNSGISVGGALAYLIQTSAAAANPTFSWTNVSSCNAVIGNIQPPAATGGSGGAWAYA